MPDAMQFCPSYPVRCDSRRAAITSLRSGMFLCLSPHVKESTSHPRRTDQNLRTLHSDLRHGQLASPRRRRIYGTTSCRGQFRLDCSEAPCRRRAPVKEPQYLDVMYRSLHVAGSTSRQCRAHNSLCKSRSDLCHNRLATARRRCTHEMMSCKVQSDPSCSVSPCRRHALVVESRTTSAHPRDDAIYNPV